MPARWTSLRAGRMARPAIGSGCPGSGPPFHAPGLVLDEPGAPPPPRHRPAQIVTRRFRHSIARRNRPDRRFGAMAMARTAPEPVSGIDSGVLSEPILSTASLRGCRDRVRRGVDRDRDAARHAQPQRPPAPRLWRERADLPRHPRLRRGGRMTRVAAKLAGVTTRAMAAINGAAIRFRHAFPTWAPPTRPTVATVGPWPRTHGAKRDWLAFLGQLAAMAAEWASVKAPLSRSNTGRKPSAAPMPATPMMQIGAASIGNCARNARCSPIPPAGSQITATAEVRGAGGRTGLLMVGESRIRKPAAVAAGRDIADRLRPGQSRR